MYPQISHITYHYLLNGSALQGNYLYDVMHLPNKSFQEKVLGDYLEDRLKKLQIIVSDPTHLRCEEAINELKEIDRKKNLKDKVHVLFKNSYERIGLDKVLNKPYFGVWGIHTTPADLFGLHNPRYRYRVGIDCTSIDPSLVIVKVSTGQYDPNNFTMKKQYFKYSSAVWNKYCKPFTENNDLTNKAYNNSHTVRTVSSGVPDVIFFVPRLRFDPKNFAEAIR